MVARAGSQRRRADWWNKLVLRLLARIKLSMGSFEFYLDTRVSCKHQAGNLYWEFSRVSQIDEFMELGQSCQVMFAAATNSRQAR